MFDHIEPHQVSGESEGFDSSLHEKQSGKSNTCQTRSECMMKCGAQSLILHEPMIFFGRAHHVTIFGLEEVGEADTYVAHPLTQMVRFKFPIHHLIRDGMEFHFHKGKKSTY